jgi:hypothetical protein
MPITRNGKHWCNPAEDGTPSPKAQTWTCPDCKTVWRFWPDLNTWAQKDEDLTPAPAEPADTEEGGK